MTGNPEAWERQSEEFSDWFDKAAEGLGSRYAVGIPLDVHLGVMPEFFYHGLGELDVIEPYLLTPDLIREHLVAFRQDPPMVLVHGIGYRVMYSYETDDGTGAIYSARSVNYIGKERFAEIRNHFSNIPSEEDEMFERFRRLFNGSVDFPDINP